jgi:hypothetical protein
MAMDLLDIFVMGNKEGALFCWRRVYRAFPHVSLSFM